MIKYQIISGYDKTAVELHVEQHIAEGWQIAGGVAVAAEAVGTRYFQSVWIEVESKTSRKPVRSPSMFTPQHP